MSTSKAEDQSISNPLIRYEGTPPAAPSWFKSMLNVPYATHSVEVDGAMINYQRWGNRDKPGLLLVHGSGAHAHWYDFIAPAFMDEYNVVAMDLSGMGDSQWRDSYSLEQFSAEQMSVMRDAGMFEHRSKPIIAAHSFGGIVSLLTAAQFGEQLEGLALIDSTVFPPEEAEERPKPRASSNQAFFPDLPSAIARFSLRPIQPCDNHFILDHIARHSVKPVEHDHQTGWSWKADPGVWGKMDWDDAIAWETLPKVTCKLAVLRGEDSMLMAQRVADNMLKRKPAPYLSIPDAGHHVFLDKPLETISALEDFFAIWRGEAH